ncbi:TPA: acyl carrier protein [Klebsiella quasipneumoniae]|uniref:acyl carrier protein n=1 Tax=Klebsiella quasipneumoniae TaxID=1463165 RepID=UPI001939B7B6|nr:acyl carrier protein [Klebsiella quasipneumoniae]HBT0545683.1 acyl carrier protein [Klebsiella pneumoniae]MBM0924928.1 acyl carrier protein [Klebsiella quasipneumoniae]MCU8817853.1 acyl carrier protein [Klebsiella quasipneumoniae]HBT5871291.1 acyl carrier protein [Klebsiella quasipneumoniae]HBT5979720.1 acyl carrier protein [Klebsiella quasipneumoniae]
MNKLKDLLTNIFGVSESDVQDNRSLENMGLDSICIVEFQIEIERTFNIDEGRLALVNSDTLQTIMERVRELQHVELKGV